MDAVKEILLQVLIASLPACLFPLCYEKSFNYWSRNWESERQEERRDTKESYSTGFMLTCMISMVLCSLFSDQLWGVIPLNFGIVPLFALMLYGRMRDGIVLALLQLIIYPIFTENYTITGLILETGVLLYPIILLASNRFKKSDRYGKILLISLYSVVGELPSTIFPLLNRSLNLELDITIIFAAIANIVTTLLIASLFVYMIEGTMEKEKLRLQVMQLSRKYFREAEKLQQMMDAAPLSVILLDQQHGIVSINDTFLQLYRIEHPSAIRDDLLKKKLDSVLAGFQLESIITQVEKVLEGESKSNILLHNGDRTYITSTSPIKKGYTDETIGVVIILQDITELETLRKELNHVERLSLVGQMAAGITHEIRNPMSVVRGFLQLMKEQSPSSLDHYYRIVMEELDRANSIINDFLAIAQNQVVNMERCSLQDIIQELTPLLWADANLRGQSIEVGLDEQVPSLFLNAKEIKQVILNLARNGMEAMDEKGQLTLQTKLTPSGVEMIVKDIGMGIPAALKEKLFEPFYTTKVQGTGLGLALCLSIVERHGGNITVESEEGRGTAVIVFFPINESYVGNSNLLV